MLDLPIWLELYLVFAAFVVPLLITYIICLFHYLIPNESPEQIGEFIRKHLEALK